MRSRFALMGAVALGVSLTWAVGRGVAADKPTLRLTATAVDVGAVTPTGARPASTGTLDIGIERFTTDEEQARLAAILAEKGSDALLDELQKLPRVGYIRTPTSLGWDLHYARRMDLPDGGTRIVFATDRPMNFWELWHRPQSVDYQYLAGEVRIGRDGKGRGTLVPAARIDYNAGLKTIEVENYASQPVRLSEVRIEK